MLKSMLPCIVSALMLMMTVTAVAKADDEPQTPRSAHWIFLVDGPKAATSPELTQAAMDKSQTDHIHNLERLNNEGRLYAAGPVGGSDHIRGIVVMKAETPESLKEAFARDPYVRQGILTVDTHRCELDTSRIGEPVTPISMARHTMVILKKGAKWLSNRSITAKTPLDLLPGIRGAFRTHELAVSVPLRDSGDLVAVLMFRSPDRVSIREQLNAEAAVADNVVTFDAFAQYVAAGVFSPAGKVLPAAGRRARLFDGRSFAGWEGDTKKTWRIEDGALVGGSLKETVPHNDFLTTVRGYKNFDLRLKVKLVGTGFVNGGIQLRSQRTTDPPYEMSGYQADMGEGYWASLYDESRRNKTLEGPKPEALKAILKPGDWNDYVIRCEGRRIRLWLNGTLTVDYLEEDETIPLAGKIGLQIHGGGMSKASYKDITIAELP